MLNAERVSEYTHSEQYGLPSRDSGRDVFLHWAMKMCHIVPLDAVQRENIFELNNEWKDQLYGKITSDLLDATAKFERELIQSVGLKFIDYQRYLAGLISGSTSILDSIETLAEQRMNRQQTDDNQFDKFSLGDRRMQKIAIAYIDEYAANVPKVHGKAEQINIQGAPGYGKTEFMGKHLSEIDLTHVVSDVDHAREWYSKREYGYFDETDQKLIEACRIPSYRLTDAITKHAHTENKNLLMQSNMARSGFWLDTSTNPVIDAAYKGWNTIVHVLVRPEYHGFVRCSMRKRKVAPKDYRFALDGLFTVVPFALLTDATIHIHDYAQYIQSKTKLISPYFNMRQQQFSEQLNQLPQSKVNFYYHAEDLDIGGSVLDL